MYKHQHFCKYRIFLPYIQIHIFIGFSCDGAVCLITSPWFLLTTRPTGAHLVLSSLSTHTLYHICPPCPQILVIALSNIVGIPVVVQYECLSLAPSPSLPPPQTYL